MSALDEAVEVVGELRRVELFAELPEECLRRVAEAGRMVHRAPGEVSRQEGDPVDAVFVLLDGEIRITQRAGEQERVIASYATPTLFGEIPLIMGNATFWATGRAVTAVRIFEVPPAAFWELMSTCPDAAVGVMREMANRLSALEAVAQSRQRLLSMGTLAAGLAHELNNPASAARRATAELERCVEEVGEHSAYLGALLQDPECEALDDIRRGVGPPPAGTMERMEREDACAAWLASAGVDDGLAPGLADCGTAPADLDRIREAVGPEALPHAVAWLEVRLRAASLARTASGAAARVAAVVDAVRGYTRLGEAPLTALDLNDALRSTLVVMGPRLAGVAVEPALDPALPPVRGYAGELNQVWTALLENAADALEGRGGRVRLRTSRDGDHARVEVEDDGPGIPDDSRERLFDAFFTTKEVGRGTGLGLSTAFRVVSEHGGTLRFRSHPGRTVFEVRLPFDPPLAER